jgi:lipid A disaccharide synthetase
LLFHRKPAVIVYRVSAIVMLLQLVLLRSRFITLVNMLDLERVEKSANPPYDPDQSDCQVPMPEYLTWRDASPQVATWVRRWFEDPRVYAERVQRLEQLAGKFAHAGASQRAAEFVWQKLQRGRAFESSAARSDRQVA